MKHLSETTLALYAGGDLGLVARWRAECHLAGCERCRGDVEAFSDMRAELSALGELPGLSWNRLAMEMKANIRLGIEAGECVRSHGSAPVMHTFWAGGMRTLLAYASVIALVLAGLLLETPAPVASRSEGAVLEATGSGITLKENGQMLSLLHGRAHDVTYSAGAQGTMRARYVDADTGYITINNVYVQ